MSDAGHDLETMGDDEAWRLVAGQEVGRLAFCVAGRPEIFPVNYRLAGHTVVVRTAPGLKLAGSVLGAGVAFEVDSLDAQARTGWSVVIHGQASEIMGTEARLEAEELVVRPWVEAQPRERYLRITPERITGRRIA